jgi:hypothetical protein
MVNEDSYLVPPKLLEAFRRDGVVVLPGVFTEEEILEAKTGLATTLKIHEVVSKIMMRLRCLLSRFLPPSRSSPLSDTHCYVAFHHDSKNLLNFLRSL